MPVSIVIPSVQFELPAFRVFSGGEVCPTWIIEPSKIQQGLSNVLVVVYVPPPCTPTLEQDIFLTAGEQCHPVSATHSTSTRKSGCGSGALNAVRAGKLPLGQDSE
jgi:hypothetical protein